MIPYELDRMNIFFAFSLKGSVFPKAFVMAFVSSLCAVAVHMMVYESDRASELVGASAVGTNILSGFTFILGFLIVFRCQQAYARWWEGGGVMQRIRAHWFTAYSNCIALSNQSKEKYEQVTKFQHQLARLMSLLYAFSIMEVSKRREQILDVIDISGFDPEDLRFLQSDDCHSPCEVVLQWVQRLIIDAETEGALRLAPPLLSRVFNLLGMGVVYMRDGRKIMDLPIPFPLAQMITVMLLFHGIATPVICASTIHSPYWAPFLSFVVVFSYWTINYTAAELEMPYGEDMNDLPLMEMQTDMNNSLLTLLLDQARKRPEYYEAEEPVTGRQSIMMVNLNTDLSEVCIDPETARRAPSERKARSVLSRGNSSSSSSQSEKPPETIQEKRVKMGTPTPDILLGPESVQVQYTEELMNFGEHLRAPALAAQSPSMCSDLPAASKPDVAGREAHETPLLLPAVVPGQSQAGPAAEKTWLSPVQSPVAGDTEKSEEAPRQATDRSSRSVSLTRCRRSPPKETIINVRATACCMPYALGVPPLRTSASYSGWRRPHSFPAQGEARTA